MARQIIRPATVRQIRGSDTQAEFARLVGCHSPVIISRWEHGVCRPSPVFGRILAQIARDRHVPIA